MTHAEDDDQVERLINEGTLCRVPICDMPQAVLTGSRVQDVEEEQPVFV